MFVIAGFCFTIGVTNAVFNRAFMFEDTSPSWVLDAPSVQVKLAVLFLLSIAGAFMFLKGNKSMLEELPD